jgi:hypothetical protein
MNTLTEILRNIVGLFIDDEFLAIAVFAVVALTGLLTLVIGVPPMFAGAVLFGGNVLVLVLGVLRTARQK